MNETLEAMARALFKSWFVDFDPVRAKAEGRDPGLPKPFADLFPASFEDSELGEIPEGWEVGKVGQYMVNHDSKRVPVSGSERAKRRGPYAPSHQAASTDSSGLSAERIAVRRWLRVHDVERDVRLSTLLLRMSSRVATRAKPGSSANFPLGLWRDVFNVVVGEEAMGAFPRNLVDCVDEKDATFAHVAVCRCGR